MHMAEADLAHTLRSRILLQLWHWKLAQLEVSWLLLGTLPLLLEKGLDA